MYSYLSMLSKRKPKRSKMATTKLAIETKCFELEDGTIIRKAVTVEVPAVHPIPIDVTIDMFGISSIEPGQKPVTNYLSGDPVAKYDRVYKMAVDAVNKLEEAKALADELKKEAPTPAPAPAPAPAPQSISDKPSKESSKDE